MAADNVELLALALAGCAPSGVELKLLELAAIFAAGAVWRPPRLSDPEACGIGQADGGRDSPNHRRTRWSGVGVMGAAVSGVTRRFVQNRTLSGISATEQPFAYERLRTATSRAANPGDFSFKTLFHNQDQRQSAYETAASGNLRTVLGSSHP